MGRKLIIDGNAVYEIDEECMLKRRVDQDRDCGDKSEERTGVKNKYQENSSRMQKDK